MLTFVVFSGFLFLVFALCDIHTELKKIVAILSIFDLRTEKIEKDKQKED